MWGILTTVLTLLVASVACIRLWSAPGVLPAAIPAACRAMMAADIVCGPQIIFPHQIINDGGFDCPFLEEYCNSTCSASMDSYISNVVKRCGNEQYDFGDGQKISAPALVAPIKLSRDTACLAGKSTTDFCYPKIVNHTTRVCNECTLKYLANMMGLSQGVNKIDQAAFASILSSCKVSPTRYPYLNITRPSLTPPNITRAPNITCRGGTQYITRQGDTCKSVAAANSMALDRFLYLNGIDFKCESFTIGAEVCIRDSCKLHTLAPQETCKQITKTFGFTKLELGYWNPILEGAGCDNITALEGRSICISPPGTDEYKSPAVSSNNSWTWPDGSWVPAPTEGRTFNMTTSTWIIPTTTMAETSPLNSSIAAYFTACPLTDQMWEDGFDWELLSGVCSALFEKYCDPELTGTPLVSTVFPNSCFPLFPEPTDV